MLVRLLLGRQKNGHVAGPLADPGRPSEGARPVPLEGRTLVDEGLVDLQLVGDELVVVLRVGDCGVQELQDVPRGRARRVDEYGTRLVDRLAADVVDDEPRLARRGADVAGLRADDHLPVAVAARGRLAALAGGHLGGPAAAALGL